MQSEKIKIIRKKEDKLKPELIRYIKQMANEIEYGKIIITLNETSKKIDVSVEHKKKFEK